MRESQKHFPTLESGLHGSNFRIFWRFLTIIHTVKGILQSAGGLETGFGLESRFSRTRTCNWTWTQMTMTQTWTRTRTSWLGTRTRSRTRPTNIAFFRQKKKHSKQTFLEFFLVNKSPTESVISKTNFLAGLRLVCYLKNQQVKFIFEAKPPRYRWQIEQSPLQPINHD